MARVSLPTPTLHADRLRVRPFVSADADALYALHSNAHVLRYWDSPPWNEPARAERFIAALPGDGRGGQRRAAGLERASDARSSAGAA